MDAGAKLTVKESPGREKENYERPLVTFALLAYNQEAYIREALEGALSQDYPNLEIILSDDFSHDQTFEIMREAASQYSGPHRILLNRNKENLNVGRHVNLVNSLANGDLIIAAAGDDISVAYRVSELVKAWLNSDKQAWLLHSSRKMMTREGVILRERGCRSLGALESIEFAVRKNAHVAGATEAWDKRLFEKYGDLNDDLVHEDKALTFRSLLANKKIVYVNQPLVLYRTDVGITSSYYGGSLRSASKRNTLLNRLRADVRQQFDDLKVVPNQSVEEYLRNIRDKYDVALTFEKRMPGVSELWRLIARVGMFYVIRMIVKRVASNLRGADI